MRAYRTPVTAVLALVVGLGLLLPILGCQKRIYVISMVPERMVLAPKVGDTLRWSRPSSETGKLTLTIPETLCIPTPNAKLSEQYNVYTVDVGPQGVDCKILRQPNASGQPIIFHYEHQHEAMPEGSQQSTSKPVSQSDSNIMLLDIVGSCGGCDGRRYKKRLLTTDSDPAYAVACIGKKPNDTPSVIDDYYNTLSNIDVPGEVSSVTWIPPGGTLAVTFPLGSGVTRPCLNGDLNSSGQLTLNGSSPCMVNPNAFPTAGKPDQPYTYTVSASTCSKNPSSSFTMTLQAPAKPKQ
jgi:hypothetical protein